MGALGNIMSGINSHVPVSRCTLSECLEKGSGSYRTRSGDTVEMDPAEIEYLGTVCDSIDSMKLRLPISIRTDVSGDAPAWEVDGVVESKVIAAVLGKTKIRDDMIRFYNPDYRVLVKKLPTTTTVLFI